MYVFHKNRQPLVGHHAAENHLKPSILPFCGPYDPTAPELTTLPDPAILQSDSLARCRAQPAGHKMFPVTPKHKAFPLSCVSSPNSWGPPGNDVKSRTPEPVSTATRIDKNNSVGHTKMSTNDIETNTILTPDGVGVATPLTPNVCP